MKPDLRGLRLGKMRHWWADTLFKRLFLLMWLGLVASHLLAFVITMRVHAPLSLIHISEPTRPY